MTGIIPDVVLLESLFRLRRGILAQALPEKIMAAALMANPWYTPYYIAQSLWGIQSWLEEEKLYAFLAQYPHRSRERKKVGIITAGNLPLVGFHDVLVGVLSGHEIYVRPSHQDQVLTHWLISAWMELLPQLRHTIKIVSDLPEIDFLIATGSNNTARYLRHQFQSVPCLIRHNRFSIALLDQTLSDQNLAELCRDVLLYNGLGCRNVSTLILYDDFDLNRWLRSLQQYSKHSLNPHYLERVLHEKHKMRMLKTSFIDGGVILMQTVNTLKYASMGVLNLLKVQNKEALNSILRTNRGHLQCIVGIDTPYGQTQTPAIDDFADRIDTMELLTSL